MTRVKLIEDNTLKAGFVDSIISTEGTLEISGWAINPDKKAKVQKVLILDSKYRFVDYANITRDRPDVAKFLKNPRIVRCGWHTIIENRAKDYIFFAYDEKRRVGYKLYNRVKRIAGSEPHIIPASLTTKPHSNGTIVFVSHDATRSGAPLLLLNLIKWFYRSTAFDIKIILLGEGELVNDFESIAPTLLLTDKYRRTLTEVQIIKKIKRFCGHNIILFYLNTIITSNYIHYFSEFGVPILSHIHEMENIIQIFGGENATKNMKTHSSRIICASPAVSKNLIENHNIPDWQVEVVYSFITPYFPDDICLNKKNARKKLGIDEDAFVVFGCGTLEWRKGPDIFIQTAAKLRDLGCDNFHFYWIGSVIPGQYANIQDIVKEFNLEGKVTFLGKVREDPREFFITGDAFLSSSREDSFPLVCLEGAEAGCPVLCFKEAGGMPDFIENDAGFVVPLDNIDEMARRLLSLANDSELREKLGNCARFKVKRKFLIDSAARQILQLIRSVCGIQPFVSIVVPNYNKVKFLEKRLNSIMDQTFKDFELIILDDNSSDGSREFIDSYIQQHEGIKTEYNNKNAGVFHQWFRGIELAQSDIIWIAEADDYSRLQYLERILPAFADPDIHLAYCDSYAIDSEDHILYRYSDSKYLTDISQTKWRNSYIQSGQDEVISALGIKNTIPNASAVIFRRFDASPWLSAVKDMELAGDWLFYLFALRNGKVSYLNDPLNYHRRYDETCIARAEVNKKRFEEVFRVQKIASDLFDITPPCVEQMIRHGRAVWESIGINQEFPIDEYKSLRRNESTSIPSMRSERWILITTYIADISGAPNTILRIARILKEKYHYRCFFLIAVDGPLRKEFEKIGPVKIFHPSRLKEQNYYNELKEFIQEKSPIFAVCNGMESSAFINRPHTMKIPIITLIHEFADYYPKNIVDRICKQSNHMIYSAHTVYDSTVRKIGWKPQPVTFVPQGLQNPDILNGDQQKARRNIRIKHGLDKDGFVVMSCGLMHTRKGCDLFVGLAEKFFKLLPEAKAHFIWVGPYNGTMEDPSSYRFWVESDIEKSELSGKVVFLGEQKDIVPYFLAADVFTLTSRLDPFPNVVLEAMAASIPVLCFDKGTGAVEAVGEEGGYIVPYLDLHSMAERLVHLYTHEDERERMGLRNKKVIKEKFVFENYVVNIHDNVLKNFLGENQN